MKRKLLAAVLISTMIAASLTGCGGSGSSEKEQAETEQAQPAETAKTETTKASEEATTKEERAEKNTGEGSEKTLKLATDADMEYPTTKALSYLAEKVYEKTDGRIGIQIFPSSTLGDEVSYMDQVQMGTVDIAKLSVGTISGLDDNLQVFLLPFIFQDGNQMWEVLEGDVGKMALDDLEQYGLHGLGFTDCGSRCFYTVDKVEKVEDLKGKTIRVQSNNLMTSMIEDLGANPVNVAANEVYSALQTGVAQGGENNLNTILNDSLYEVAKYVILDNHTTTMDFIVINNDLWNSLSSEDQQAFEEAMKEATAYDREIWDASIEGAKQKLIDGGTTITTPDEAALLKFREAVSPIYEEYSKNYGEWIDAINKAEGN